MTNCSALGGSGGTLLSGPGYGNFAQTTLLKGGAKVGHLWNYGLNTWGFEDQYGGGDADCNDLMAPLDFTSAAGHGWLV
ncbi:MAG: hypothetical protein FJX11_16350 [Alphaproteobacteria bacterium]|nr:hypothetical protein [Alphaproteobacteria bacterium]